MAHVEIHVLPEPEHTDADVLVTARATSHRRGSPAERFLGHVEARFRDGGWHVVGPIGDPAPDVLAVLVRDVLAAAVATVAGPAEWWVEAADGGTDRAAEAAGLHVGRELLQMRRPLPVGLDFDLATRPFVVGQDEAAWLEVNNAAFDWHEDQSNWTVEQLVAKEREPWFDAEGFLLAELDGRLAGFCWTKVHDATVPPLGEIFVIAVHPAFHGRGLGRALTLAGLDHLASRGLEVGMLYVEADNVGAVALYRDLGFEVHHRDRRYESPQAGVSTPSSDPTA